MALSNPNLNSLILKKLFSQLQISLKVKTFKFRCILTRDIPRNLYFIQI